jgi:UDP-N-acetylmuramate dehydrogenase
MSRADLHTLIAEVQSAGIEVLVNRPLSNLTTYAVGGTAAASVTVSALQDLQALAAVTARYQNVPVHVVGRGSNTLISDTGVDGLVVFVSAPANEAVIELDGDDVVVAGSVTMPVLARRSVKAGRSGLEWCVGIPGSVGGAVRMNAGGHGAEMVDTLQSALVVSLWSGRSVSIPTEQLGLHFRGSALASHHIVAAARLRTGSCEVAVGQKELDAVVAWRREHQPGGRNAGSVFVNPAPGAGSAGALIDSCELRGFQVGEARVSEKHANFIQASDGATASDIVAVMSHVQDTVLDKHGILLRSEVCLLGFDEVIMDRFADPRHGDTDRVSAGHALAVAMGDIDE